MSKISILLCSQNKNKTLADTIEYDFSAAGYTVHVMDLVALQWPLYSSQEHANHGVPNTLDSINKHCQSSQGFVVVAPEYNGGIPPVFTNTMAWLSVANESWRDGFNGKLAGIATFSGGGGGLLVSALRLQLAHIGLTVVGLPLMATYQKSLNPDSLSAFVDQWVTLCPPVKNS